MTLKEELAKLRREMEEEFESPNRSTRAIRIENRVVQGICSRYSERTHLRAPKSRRVGKGKRLS